MLGNRLRFHATLLGILATFLGRRLPGLPSLPNPLRFFLVNGNLGVIKILKETSAGSFGAQRKTCSGQQCWLQ